MGWDGVKMVGFVGLMEDRVSQVGQVSQINQTNAEQSRTQKSPNYFPSRQHTICCATRLTYYANPLPP